MPGPEHAGEARGGRVVEARGLEAERFQVLKGAALEGFGCGGAEGLGGGRVGQSVSLVLGVHTYMYECTYTRTQNGEAVRGGAHGAQVQLLEGRAEAGAEGLGEGAGAVGADVVEIKDQHLIVCIHVCVVVMVGVCTQTSGTSPPTTHLQLLPDARGPQRRYQLVHTAVAEAGRAEVEPLEGAAGTCVEIGWWIDDACVCESNHA